MKILLIIILTLPQVFANGLNYSSSSVPGLDQSWSASTKPLFDRAINKDKPIGANIHLKVKVFPHTLKKDFLHGTRDIKTQVKLAGNISLNGFSYRNLDLRYRKGIIVFRSNGNIVYRTKLLNIDTVSPVKIIRKNNEDKSHSYLGELTIKVHDGGIMIINTVEIEEYLRGVVPKESVHSWPIDALKAQALAARSYAYYHYLTSRKPDYHVDDTARFQVYAGVSAAMESTDQAIADTAGEVLTHKGRVITAFFHAYSGGRTDSAKNIFGKHVEYCIGDKEIFSREELKAELPVRSHWVVEWTTEALSRGALLKILKSSNVTKKLFAKFKDLDFLMEEQELNTLFNSVKTMKFEQGRKNIALNFVKIRSAIGWSKFPAYHFRIESNQPREVIFKGNGWGHHVGMSQWGAMVMAKNYGKTYKEILHHYYHDVSIENLAQF